MKSGWKSPVCSGTTMQMAIALRASRPQSLPLCCMDLLTCFKL